MYFRAYDLLLLIVPTHTVADVLTGFRTFYLLPLILPTLLLMFLFYHLPLILPVLLLKFWQAFVLFTLCLLSYLCWSLLPLFCYPLCVVKALLLIATVIHCDLLSVVIILLLVTIIFFIFYFCNVIVPLGLLPGEIRVMFPRESQLRQSRATQTTVHAWCFNFSAIHLTLTWTTGSLTCVYDLFACIHSSLLPFVTALLLLPLSSVTYCL